MNGETPPSCSLPSTLGETRETELVAISGPEFAKEEDCSASCVHGKPPRRLQTDFPYQVLVTSGHTTVWQNKVTLQVRCLAMLQQWL